MALSRNQKRFVDEYLIDLNGTRAYKAAYPSVKNDDTAASSASRLLNTIKIQDYINRRMKEREERTEITQDMVVRELAAIAFSKITNYAKIGKELSGQQTGKAYVEIESTENLTEEQQKAIAAIKNGKYGIEIKIFDKIQALELLGRHLGMFKEKLEIAGVQDEMSKLDDLLRQVKGYGDG